MTYGPRGAGPLWFAIALLIFALPYVAWQAVRPHPVTPASALPPPRAILLAIVAVGLSAFAVRLVMPVGREILWLQLGYFPSYIVLFAAGVAVAPHHLIERVTLREARPWLALALLALATLPLMVATRGATGVFEGGMNLNALYYAIWEPRVATGVILGWFAGASPARHAAAPATTWIAAGAFGAFILHPPVVVASAILAATWTAAPWIKFLVVSAAACGASFALAGVVRLLPVVRRVI